MRKLVYHLYAWYRRKYRRKGEVWASVTLDRNFFKLLDIVADSQGNIYQYFGNNTMLVLHTSQEDASGTRKNLIKICLN